jgi:hypothetical protein
MQWLNDYAAARTRCRVLVRPGLSSHSLSRIGAVVPPYRRDPGAAYLTTYVPLCALP